MDQVRKLWELLRKMKARTAIPVLAAVVVLAAGLAAVYYSKIDFGGGKDEPKPEREAREPVVEADANDIALLARLIYGEARAEPYVGQVAVGAVVLNRVQSPNFPNTIPGVIYEPGAFSVVWDGQINLTPNREAYRAARDALGGTDPSNGALYYYNPSKSWNAWIRSRPVITTIGNHVFAR